MRFFFAAVLPLVFLSTTAVAADADDVIVSRGDHVVTLADLDARMSRFPPGERAQFAREPENLGRMMDRMLVDSVLEAEARELGIDKRPDVQRDLALAVREVLATHRLNEFLMPANEPDFRPIARERYLANPRSFDVPRTQVVEHVLVRPGDEGDAGALATAQKVFDLASKPGADFAALVAEYSDDPSKADNNGRFTITSVEGFVPEFAEAAMALTTPGELTGPVKTSFGYHVIRLVQSTPGRERNYDEVEPELLAKAHRDYRDNHRVDYLAAVRSRFPESGNEELLRELPARYGGRPEDAAPAE